MKEKFALAVNSAALVGLLVVTWPIAKANEKINEVVMKPFN